MCYDKVLLAVSAAALAGCFTDSHLKRAELQLTLADPSVNLPSPMKLQFLVWSLALYLFLGVQLLEWPFLACAALRVTGTGEISLSVKEQTLGKVGSMGIAVQRMQVGVQALQGQEQMGDVESGFLQNELPFIYPCSRCKPRERP